MTKVFSRPPSRQVRTVTEKAKKLVELDAEMKILRGLATTSTVGFRPEADRGHRIKVEFKFQIAGAL